LHPVDPDNKIIYKVDELTYGKDDSGADIMHSPLIIYDSPWLPNGDPEILLGEAWVDLGKPKTFNPSFVKVRETNATSVLISVKCPVEALAEPEYNTLKRVAYKGDCSWTYGGKTYDSSHPLPNLFKPMAGWSSYEAAISSTLEQAIALLIALACDDNIPTRTKSIDALKAMIEGWIHGVKGHLNVKAHASELLRVKSSVTWDELIEILSPVEKMDLQDPKKVEGLITSLVNSLYGVQTFSDLLHMTIPLPSSSVNGCDWKLAFDDAWKGMNLYETPRSVLTDTVHRVADARGVYGSVFISDARSQVYFSKLLSYIVDSKTIMRGWN
jgi:hypothetical protein